MLNIESRGHIKCTVVVKPPAGLLVLTLSYLGFIQFISLRSVGMKKKKFFPSLSLFSSRLLVSTKDFYVVPPSC